MRRGSIARLMVAVGLIGLALELLRGWAGPANRFGFLGLLGFVVLVAGIGSIVAAGACRRFLVGFGGAGFACWLAVLAAPMTVLDWERDCLLLPAYRWNLAEPDLGLTRVELAFLRAELGEQTFDRNPATWYRSRLALYGGCQEIQLWLLAPMLVPATLAGLVVAWAGRYALARRRPLG